MARRVRGPVVWREGGPGPYGLYLPVERSALAEIAEELQDAGAEIDKRILQLARRPGLAATVRRAQFTLIKREIVAVQQTLWGRINRTIRTHGTSVAHAAARAEETLQRLLFGRANQVPPEDFLASQRLQAEKAVTTYFARRQGKLPLSSQVVRTRALSQGWINREINRVILQGGSWQELSNRLQPLLNPTVPGGVSYAAKRLARTELNNAFHAASITTSARNPYSLGMQWYLSGTHGTPDRCDVLSTEHSPGRPRGVYAPGEVPAKPHPQCRCFVASVSISEEAFMATLLNPPASSSAATA